MAVGSKGRVLRLLGGVLLAVVVGGGALIYLERDPLRAQLFVRNLVNANDDSARHRWAGYVGDLGEPAVPDLCAHLHDENPRICKNVQAGLIALADHWGHNDPHTVALVQTLAQEMGQFSLEGQRLTLELVKDWFRLEDAPPGDALIVAVARLLAATETATDPDVEGAALDLASAVASRGPSGLAAARDVVRTSLHAATPAMRARAVQLSLISDMNLQIQVAGLLVDPDVEVRRKAIVAVGPDNNKVPADMLLPCLHDTDPEVRRLCRDALSSSNRAFTPAGIRLAYVLSDPDPLERVKVLKLAFEDPEMANLIEPIELMRRLSHDSSPAVRTAAMRVMSTYREIDVSDQPSPTAPANLIDRIAEMASNTAEEDSVRQIAPYYYRVALGQVAE